MVFLLNLSVGRIPRSLGGKVPEDISQLSGRESPDKLSLGKVLQDESDLSEGKVSDFPDGNDQVEGNLDFPGKPPGGRKSRQRRLNSRGFLDEIPVFR